MPEDRKKACNQEEGNQEEGNQEQIKSKNFKDEYTKKAIESMGGSMVFIERGLMVWDGESED